MSKLITDKQKASLRKAGYAEVELQGLTVLQASALLHYVVHNGWKRPTQAQVEAIAADEMNADDEVSRKAVPLARIPSSEELEELTKDFSLARICPFYDAMDNLKRAVSKGKEALVEQGRALSLLKEACERRSWGKVLNALGLPRTTAHRQILIAKAHAAADDDLRTMLTERGIRFDSQMSAKHLRLVHRAAEAAQKAKDEANREVRDLFQNGTNPPENDDSWAHLEDQLQRQKRIKATAEEKIIAFLDKELEPGTTLSRKATPTTDLSSTSPTAADADSIARDITSLVIERLQRMPHEARREVWRLVGRYVEAEGVFPETQEVAHVAAA